MSMLVTSLLNRGVEACFVKLGKILECHAQKWLDMLVSRDPGSFCNAQLSVAFCFLSLAADHAELAASDADCVVHDTPVLFFDRFGNGLVEHPCTAVEVLSSSCQMRRQILGPTALVC